MPEKLSEVQLAAAVKVWLSAQHYQVYEEVQISRDGERADLVADVSGRAWVIEVKASLSLAVLEQAAQWHGYAAHWVSVAVPRIRQRQKLKGRWMAQRVCREFGIGLIHVEALHEIPFDVSQEIPPRLQRTVYRSILGFCHVGHQTHAAAGSANGGHWTSYRQTIEKVRAFLGTKPHGATIKEIVAAMPDHHYASTSTARASLLKWLGSVERDKGWVDCKREGRSLVFFLTHPPEAFLETAIDNPPHRGQNSQR